MICKICDHQAGKIHHTREMLFGFKDEFDYFECARCGCVQLVNEPQDMSKYYPTTYYSYQQPPAIRPLKPKNFVRRWMYEQRNEAQVFSRGGFWGTVARLHPRPEVHPIEVSVREVPGLGLHSRILDVGCGGGRLLLCMAVSGFTELTGIDPFLPNGSYRPIPEVKLLAETLEVHNDGPYDLIMMHHALEHMPDQYSTLLAAKRLLATNGNILVRIPTASSNPWRVYGTNWVALDPPRHYFVHTHESIRHVAVKCGLSISRMLCDGNAFGYSGSELYRKDISLFDPKTGIYTDHDKVLGSDQIAKFEKTAIADNLKMCGDGLVVYLTHSTGSNA